MIISKEKWLLNSQAELILSECFYFCKSLGINFLKLLLYDYACFSSGIFKYKQCQCLFLIKTFSWILLNHVRNACLKCVAQQCIGEMISSYLVFNVIFVLNV